MWFPEGASAIEADLKGADKKRLLLITLPIAGYKFCLERGSSSLLVHPQHHLRLWVKMPSCLYEHPWPPYPSFWASDDMLKMIWRSPFAESLVHKRINTDLLTLQSKQVSEPPQQVAPSTYSNLYNKCHFLNLRMHCSEGNSLWLFIKSLQVYLVAIYHAPDSRITHWC